MEISCNIKEREDSVNRWTFLGTELPKSEIVYFCQIVVVNLIIITAIVNLTINSDKSELWVSRLSSAIGYALTSPTLDKNKS